MICNLIFRRWALLSCSIPKNQCKSALSFHSFSESFLHLWRERKNEAQWCVLKMKQNLYQTREILFFKKKIKINYLHDHSFLSILLEFILNLEFSRETLQNFVICYVNKNSKFPFSISRFVLVYFIFSSIINTLVFYVDIDWDVH